MARLDLKNQKFGKLTALCIDHIEHREPKKLGTITYWKCQCECGNFVVVSVGGLRSGRTKSCGCYQIERAKEANKKHGKTKTKIHHIWQGIKQRCFTKTNKNFSYYGGRGITMCDEWKNDFKVFYDWAMKNGYKEGLTIDRIDTNRNYCPENCRWATRKEQGQNTRKNIVITFKGITKTMGEWAKSLNGNRDLIRDRIKLGWSIEEALTTPVNKSRVWEKQADGTYHHKEEE